MIIKVSMTLMSKRTVVIDVPDGKYTEDELKQKAIENQILSTGSIIESHCNYDSIMATNLYEIDGKAV